MLKPAEIPDENLYRELYKLLKQHVIHGPCGYQNLNSPCMNEDKSKCTKNFPKQYNEEIIFPNIGSYPVYKRRNCNPRTWGRIFWSAPPRRSRRPRTGPQKEQKFLGYPIPHLPASSNFQWRGRGPVHRGEKGGMQNYVIGRRQR